MLLPAASRCGGSFLLHPHLLTQESSICTFFKKQNQKLSLSIQKTEDRASPWIGLGLGLTLQQHSEWLYFCPDTLSSAAVICCASSPFQIHLSSSLHFVQEFSFVFAVTPWLIGPRSTVFSLLQLLTHPPLRLIIYNF